MFHYFKLTKDAGVRQTQRTFLNLKTKQMTNYEKESYSNTTACIVVIIAAIIGIFGNAIYNLIF